MAPSSSSSDPVIDGGKADVLGHHEHHAGVVRRSDHAVGVGQRIGQWLFAEPVLAGLGGATAHIGVEVVRQADGDGVDAGVLEGATIVCVRHALTERMGEALGARRVDVDAPADGGAHLTKGTGVATPRPAAADHRYDEWLRHRCSPPHANRGGSDEAYRSPPLARRQRTAADGRARRCVDKAEGMTLKSPAVVPFVCYNDNEGCVDIRSSPSC